MGAENPIRIAQVIGKLMAGGVESVVYNYYRHIDKTKIQFDFFYDADSKVEPPQDLIQMGARFYKIPPYQQLFGFLTALYQYFKQNRYHIVHAHLNTLNVFPLFAAWLATVPVRISHSHSTAGKGERKNILKYALRPFAKIFPTHYCACSKYAGEWLFGKRLFENGKVKILHNAIDLEKFQFDAEVRDRVRKELGLDNKFVVGHVGRFCYQKNHEFLIHIFNEVYKQKPNAKLLLIGEGELEDSIKKQVRESGLSEEVLFLGVRKDVNELMQAMDVFVLPSRYEGLGMVAIEAQAVSTNTICSEAVPFEAKLTDHFKYVPCGQPAVVWAGELLSCGLSRETTANQIMAAGYDINKEARLLEEYYDSRIGCTQI